MLKEIVTHICLGCLSLIKRCRSLLEDGRYSVANAVYPGHYNSLQFFLLDSSGDTWKTWECMTSSSFLMILRIAGNLVCITLGTSAGVHNDLSFLRITFPSWSKFFFFSTEKKKPLPTSLASWCCLACLSSASNWSNDSLFFLTTWTDFSASHTTCTCYSHSQLFWRCTLTLEVICRGFD